MRLQSLVPTFELCTVLETAKCIKLIALKDRMPLCIMRDHWKTELVGFSSCRDCDLAEPDIDVPMTPGTMLLLQNGDEMAVIRRQVAKLSRHVARLQEDNSRRRNRELILYPVIVGYCLMQLVRMFLRSK